MNMVLSILQRNHMRQKMNRRNLISPHRRFQLSLKRRKLLNGDMRDHHLLRRLSFMICSS